jgi:hypothetical protein
LFKFPAPALTLLDPIKETLDQVARPVHVRTKTNRIVSIPFRRNVGPGAVFFGERSDPVRIISSISEQHRALFSDQTTGW